MRCARCIQPLITIDLMVADKMSHAVRKNLCAASGQRIDARIAQALQSLTDRKLRASRKKRHLHHGEGLDMHLWKPLLQAAHQIKKIFERQVRMQSANNMKLGHRLGITGSGCLPCLLKCHGISAGSILLAAKSTEPAGGHAHVRWINMPVYIEISGVAVQFFT